MSVSNFRTDRNNNPAAFTTDIAKEAGLVLGTDYKLGDPFQADGRTYYTAALIGDPIALTIKVINAIGFYNKAGAQRWTYIAIPKFLWDQLSLVQQKAIVGYMYVREGGSAMKPLFS